MNETDVKSFMNEFCKKRLEERPDDPDGSKKFVELCALSVNRMILAILLKVHQKKKLTEEEDLFLKNLYELSADDVNQC